MARFKVPSTFSSNQSESSTTSATVSERVARESRKRKYREKTKEKEKRLRRERSSSLTRDEYPTARQERVKHAAAYTHGGRRAPSPSPLPSTPPRSRDVSESPLKRSFKAIRNTIFTAFGYAHDTPSLCETPSKRRAPGAFPGMSIDSDTEGPSSPTPSGPGDLGPDDDEAMLDADMDAEMTSTEEAEPGMTSDATSSPSSSLGPNTDSASASFTSLFTDPRKGDDHHMLSSADVSTEEFLAYLQLCSPECPGTHYYIDPETGARELHDCKLERLKKAEVDEDARKLEEHRQRVDAKYSKTEIETFAKTTKPSSFGLWAFRNAWRQERERLPQPPKPSKPLSPFTPFPTEGPKVWDARKYYFPDEPWTPEEREKRRKVTEMLETYNREKERKKREEAERRRREYEEKELKQRQQEEAKKERERRQAKWMQEVLEQIEREKKEREEERRREEEEERLEAEARERAAAEREEQVRAQAEEFERLRRKFAKATGRGSGYQHSSTPKTKAYKRSSPSKHTRPSNRADASTSTSSPSGSGSGSNPSPNTSSTSNPTSDSTPPRARTTSTSKPNAASEDTLATRYEVYVSTWSAIASMKDTSSLSFISIPWPMARAPQIPEAITDVAVRDFFQQCHTKGLLPSRLPRGESGNATTTTMTKEQKRAIAKTELKNWHPDKFATRVLARIWDEGERERVRRAADVVQKMLTEFMIEGAS